MRIQLSATQFYAHEDAGKQHEKRRANQHNGVNIKWSLGHRKLGLVLQRCFSEVLETRIFTTLGDLAKDDSLVQLESTRSPARM